MLIEPPQEPTEARTEGAPAREPERHRRPLVRIIAALLALGSLVLTLLIPPVLLYLSIGSVGCLGEGCSSATTLAVVSGAAGLAAGLVATVMLILTAFRPRRAKAISAAIALLVLAIAIATQVGSLSSLRNGQATYGSALQTGFGVDSAMQEILFAATGLTIWGDDGLTGPIIDATACTLADGSAGYQATAAITLSDRLQPAEADRDGLARFFDSSRERLLTLDPQLPVTHDWLRTDAGWRWTVATECRPLSGLDAVAPSGPVSP